MYRAMNGTADKQVFITNLHALKRVACPKNAFAQCSISLPTILLLYRHCLIDRRRPLLAVELPRVPNNTLQARRRGERLPSPSPRHPIHAMLKELGVLQSGRAQKGADIRCQLARINNAASTGVASGGPTR